MVAGRAFTSIREGVLEIVLGFKEGARGSERAGDDV